MRERRYKYTVWGGPLRQAQGPDSCATVSEPVELAVKLIGRGSFATVGELAELAVKLRDRGSFAKVSEPAELADISCTRVS